MSTIWITGFEHGTLSASGGGLFNAITGAGPTVQGTTKRTGNYALQVVSQAADSYVSKTWTGVAILTGRIYLRISPLYTADNLFYIRFYGASTNCYIGVRSSADGGWFAFYDPTSGWINSNVAPVAATWYRIDFRIDTTNKKFDWKIDGTAQNQITIGTMGNSTGIDLGVMYAGITTTIQFDDIIFTNTSGDYPIGAGKVQAISPNAAGTSSPNPATKIYDAGGTLINDSSNPANPDLADVPISESTTYIKQTTIGASDYVEVNFADLSDAATVNGAMAILAYKSSGTALNNGKSYVIDEDAGSTTLFSGDMSESTVFYKSVQLPAPSGGWDQAAVNALKARVGYSSDITPVPYWCNLMIEVDYVATSGSIYNEAPANSFSSTPAQSHSTFLAISPSLGAFVSTPALNRVAAADMVGSVAMASTPALNRAAIADFYNTLTWPSTPAVSAIGGMSLFNTLTFASTPTATMAYFLGIFPSLTLASTPALSTSALATFYNSLTLASTPAAVMAAIGNFFKSLTLASSPALSAVGGSEFYNTLTVASGPAFSTATFKAAAGSVSLASAPTFATTNWMSLLAAITLASTPALARTGNLDILVSRIMSSSPAFTTTGGMDLYNSIALLSNPALAAAVFKAAFPSVSLASIPALSIAAKADLLAQILAASSPGFLAACGFDFIETLILASAGTFSLVSELTSGPVISAGYERAMSMTAKQAEEILVREMASTAKRLSEQMEKRPAPKATRRDS